MSNDDLSRLRARATSVATLVELFREDSDRAASLTFDACGIHADFSRQLIDRNFLKDLFEFAKKSEIESRLQAMFAGEAINTTEHRAVMHVALRDSHTRSPEAQAAALQLSRARALAGRARPTRDP